MIVTSLVHMKITVLILKLPDRTWFANWKMMKCEHLTIITKVRTFNLPFYFYSWDKV